MQRSWRNLPNFDENILNFCIEKGSGNVFFVTFFNFQNFLSSFSYLEWLLQLAAFTRTVRLELNICAFKKLSLETRLFLYFFCL